MLVKNLNASELTRRNQSRAVYSNYLIQEKLVQNGQQIRLNLVGGSGGSGGAAAASDLLAINTGVLDLTQTERDAVVNNVIFPSSAPVVRPTSATYRYIMFSVTKVTTASESPAVTEFALYYRGARVSWAAGVTSRFTNSAGVAYPDASQGGNLTTGGADGSSQNFVDGSLQFKAWEWPSDTSLRLVPNYMVVDNTTGITFDAYSWATADHIPRDPIRWAVYGSNDRTTFTILDDKTTADQTVPATRSAYIPVINLVF